MNRLSAALLCAVMLSPVVAFADACDNDRLTVCQEFDAGEGRKFDCLLARQDKTTPECAAAANKASMLADGVVGACGQDAQRWCAQYADSGRQRIIDCLKAHKDKVGRDCKKAYGQFKSFSFDLKS